MVNRPRPELASLPASSEDELLFGRLGRFARLIPSQSRTILERLLHHPFGVPASGLPCGLDALVDYFCHTETAASVIEANTLLPYFRPYLSVSQLERAYVSVRGSRGGSLKPSLGLCASRLGAAITLRICPDCYRSDLERGVPTWRRVHQLAGVLLCPNHLVPLMDTSRRARDCRHQLFLPDDVISRAQEFRIRPSQIPALASIALASRSLLSSRQDPVSASDLSSLYSSLVRKAGLATSGGSTRLRTLRRVFADRWDALLPLAEFRWLRDGSWTESMLCRSNRAVHPLKHLILCLTLGAEAEDFGQISSYASDARLELPPSHVAKPEVRTLTILENESCRSAAARQGVSVNTVLVYARRTGAEFTARPKKIDEPYQKLIEAALVLGEPLKDIAAQLSVSNSSVWRLLRSNTALEQEWRRASHEIARTRNRASWTEALAKNATCVVSRARVSVPASYAWLYRNDREWLRSSSDSAHQSARPFLRTSVDWARRDWRWASEILRAANELRIAGTLYARVSPSRILRLLSIETSFRRNEVRLPLSAAALSRTSETIAECQARRVIYWQRQLLSKQITPAPWIVKRLAGLPSHTSDSVAEVLSSILGGALEVPDGVSTGVPRPAART